MADAFSGTMCRKVPNTRDPRNASTTDPTGIMFLAPLMLVGIGAAVVPFVLHLLSRARYKDVEWGAMMFPSGADVRRIRTPLPRFCFCLCDRRPSRC